VAEVSIHVGAAVRRQRVGQTLLEALVDASQALGLWTLQASLLGENEASVRLHRRFGFRVMGVQTRITRMTYGPWAGRWRDTTMTERRSATVGPG
jgi:phosphinothricin acetyltransferase